MGNMMTFLNSHFTWLGVSRRSLPRLRRLPRSQPPNHFPLSLISVPFLLIIAKTNNLGDASNASSKQDFHYFFCGDQNVSGFTNFYVLSLLQRVREWSIIF